jgi:hypothetical protein
MLIKVNIVSGILYFIIVNISVIMKNAKIEVDGSGGAVEVFVVGNVLGDCNCGSVGAGAGGSPVVVVSGCCVVLVLLLPFPFPLLPFVFCCEEGIVI